MYTWNPSSHSTPLERARPQPSRIRPDFSVIPESPIQDRILLPSKRTSSSLLVRQQSGNDQFFTAAKDRIASPPREPIFSTSAANGRSDRASSSILSPRSEDEFDAGSAISPTGISPFSSEEKVDLEQANVYLDICIKKDLTKIDIADQLSATTSGEIWFLVFCKFLIEFLSV